MLKWYSAGGVFPLRLLQPLQDSVPGAFGRVLLTLGGRPGVERLDQTQFFDESGFVHGSRTIVSRQGLPDRLASVNRHELPPAVPAAPRLRRLAPKDTPCVNGFRSHPSIATSRLPRSDRAFYGGPGRRCAASPVAGTEGYSMRERFPKTGRRSPCVPITTPRPRLLGPRPGGCGRTPRRRRGDRGGGGGCPGENRPRAAGALGSRQVRRASATVQRKGRSGGLRPAW